MSQNRNKKSSCNHQSCGSFLSRHRPDARGALQQSPILQNDMDNLSEMFYNDKHKVELHNVCSELLRPFTQLNEQTLSTYLIKLNILRFRFIV
jgi:hypothetical protein